MTSSVAIIAPGSMGAGIGQRLTEHKVTVLTSLAGRTEASAKRAREAGMQPVEDRALAEADFLLSIVPPGDAVALGGSMFGANTSVGYLKRAVDYRSVLGEIIRDHLGATQEQLNRIIPGYANEATEHLKSGTNVGTTPIIGELGII